jgi:hypothetical protein
MDDGWRSRQFFGGAEKYLEKSRNFFIFLQRFPELPLSLHERNYYVRFFNRKIPRMRRITATMAAEGITYFVMCQDPQPQQNTSASSSVYFLESASL